MRRVLAALALSAACGELVAAEFVRVPGRTFDSVLPAAAGESAVTVKPFLLQARPVTNQEFLAFVARSPQWQRDQAPALFAGKGYLRHWAEPTKPGPAAAAQAPVVNVSWFAASAYCESISARLPRWHEWELAAAADETRDDARADPAWRQRILDWYAQPGGRALREAGRGKPSKHGVHDLHGLVWEWVEDYGALMVSGDNREQGDPDLMKFCGTGSLSVEQKENYAVLMRLAMLSSLEASHSTGTLGFRCARDVGDKP